MVLKIARGQANLKQAGAIPTPSNMEVIQSGLVLQLCCGLWVRIPPLPNSTH